MDGAVLALLRIQDTYNLSTQQLADSNLGLTHKELEAPPLSGSQLLHFINLSTHSNVTLM